MFKTVKLEGSSLEVLELELGDADLANPAAYMEKMNKWHQANYSLLVKQVQALLEPNHAEIAGKLKLVDEKVAAAHAKSIEAFEKAVILEKAKPDIDRNLDLRLFGTLAMDHDPSVLNFEGGRDTWYKSRFTSKDESENASLRAFFNLLTCDMEDLAGFGEREIAILNRFRALNDRLVIEDQICRKSSLSDNYRSAGGMKSLRAYKAWENLAHQMRLAASMADANAGTGAEWVPTGVSFQLMPDVWPELALSAQIPAVPMARSPMLFTVQNPFGEARLLTEALDGVESNNTNIAAATLTTRNVTLTARKFGEVVWNSSEIEEDSVPNIAAAIRATGIFAVEAAQEKCDLNGQASAISGVYGTFPTSGQTSSTFDTGVTFTGTANDEDPRRGYDGLRYLANLAGVAEDASTGLVVDHLTMLQAKLGRFSMPSQCFWWAGYISRARMLTLKDANQTAVILTADKAGGEGSFRSGVVGKVLGVSDLVTSFYQSEDLNAAGIDIGGGGGHSQIGIANRIRLIRGTVRLIRVETSRENRFQQDQIGVKFTKRQIMRPTVQPSASDQPFGVINGIAA